MQKQHKNILSYDLIVFNLFIILALTDLKELQRHL